MWSITPPPACLQRPLYLLSLGSLYRGGFTLKPPSGPKDFTISEHPVPGTALWAQGGGASPVFTLLLDSS